MLAHGVDLGEVGQLADLLQLVVLAAGLEQRLELGRAVEVVLDRALAAGGDDEDVGEAGAHGFLDHELDRGRVDERQHLLGHGLGRRQEPGAEPGCRDDRLPDLHVRPPRAGAEVYARSNPGKSSVWVVRSDPALPAAAGCQTPRHAPVHSAGHAHLRVRVQELRPPLRDRAVDARRRRSPSAPSAAASCARCSPRPRSRSRGRASTPPTTGRRPQDRRRRRATQESTRASRSGRREVGREVGREARRRRRSRAATSRLPARQEGRPPSPVGSVVVEARKESGGS